MSGAALLREIRRERAEFLAYDLLYQTVHESGPELACAMATAWNREPRAVREEETLAHALQVVEAMAGTLNSHRFFRLYEAAPGMNGFLMDFMVFRARRESFARMKAAFSPSIDVDPETAY